MAPLIPIAVEAVEGAAAAGSLLSRFAGPVLRMGMSAARGGLGMAGRALGLGGRAAGAATAAEAGVEAAAGGSALVRGAKSVAGLGWRATKGAAAVGGSLFGLGGGGRSSGGGGLFGMLKKGGELYMLYQLVEMVKGMGQGVDKWLFGPAGGAKPGELAAASPGAQRAVSSAMGATVPGIGAAHAAERTIPPSERAPTQERGPVSQDDTRRPDGVMMRSPDYANIATVTTHVDGRPRSITLPTIPGNGDGEVLANGYKWWDQQAKSGFAQPLKPGDGITIGHGDASRRYLLNKDMQFERAGIEQSDFVRGAQLKGEDRSKALVNPKAFDQIAAGALSTGAGATFATIENGPDGPRVSVAQAVSNKMFAVTSSPNESAMSVLASHGPDNALVVKTAVSPSRDLAHQNGGGDRRLDVQPEAAPLARRLGLVADAPDPLSQALSQNGRPGVVMQALGDKPLLRAQFEQMDGQGGRKAGITLVDGRATFSILGPDGKTPAWTREIADPSIGVGRDGTVTAGPGVMKMLSGFVNDPVGRAREMEGVSPRGSFLEDMNALSGAQASRQTFQAIDELSLNKPRMRASGARGVGGIER